MALKKTTKQLIRIAKKERPKAVKYYTKYEGKSRSEARKILAGNLRFNRKDVGSKEARRLVLKGHGYGK